MAEKCSARARALHSPSISFEDKLRTAALLARDLRYEKTSLALPELVKAHYIVAVTEWTLGCVGQGATQGKQTHTRGGGPPQDAYVHPALWGLLVTVLKHPLLPPTHTLPASLVLSISRALKDLPSKVEAGKQRDAALSYISTVLATLSSKFGATYTPSLEHTVGLIEAALSVVYSGACNAQGEAATAAAAAAAVAALEFSLPTLQRHPNQRKVWDASTPRLLDALLNAGFPDKGTDSGGEEGMEIDTSLAVACRTVLQAVLFNPAHIPGLAESALGLETGGTQQPSDRHVVSYTTQFFQTLIGLATATDTNTSSPALLALPWLVSKFCDASAAFQKAAEIAAGLNEHPNYSNNADAFENNNNKGVSGGMANNPEFLFFGAIVHILLDTLQNASTTESSERSLRSLAGVCAQLQHHRIYRPTETAGAHQREMLQNISKTAANIGSSSAGGHQPECVAPSLEVLQGILAVEHRAIQLHLPTLWPMMWSCGASEAVLEAGTQVACGLVVAYAELRQLSVLLESLVEALCSADADQADSAARMVGNGRFLSVLHTSVATVPSGQVSSLARAVAGWVQSLSGKSAGGGDGTLDVAALVIADIASSCLLNLPVSSNTAVAAALAIEDVVASLSVPLEDAPQLLSSGGSKKSSARQTLAALVHIYNAALAMHRKSCLEHPEIKPLPGQELRPALGLREASAEIPLISAPLGYFAPLNAKGEGAGEKRRKSGQNWPDKAYKAAWLAVTIDEPGNPALSYAVMMAAVQRMSSLHSWLLYSHATCSTYEEANGSTPSTADQLSALRAIVEEEVEYLAGLLLTQAQAGQTKPCAVLEDEDKEEHVHLASLSRMNRERKTLALKNGIAKLPVLQELQASLPEKAQKALAQLVLELPSMPSVGALFELPNLRPVLPEALCSIAHGILSDMNGADAHAPATDGKKKAKTTGNSRDKNSTSVIDSLLSQLSKLAKGKAGRSEEWGKALQSATSALGDAPAARGTASKPADSRDTLPEKLSSKKRKAEIQAVSDGGADVDRLERLAALLTCLAEVDLWHIDTASSTALLRMSLICATVPLVSSRNNVEGLKTAALLKVVESAVQCAAKAVSGPAFFPSVEAEELLDVTLLNTLLHIGNAVLSMRLTLDVEFNTPQCSVDEILHCMRHIAATCCNAALRRDKNFPTEEFEEWLQATVDKAASVLPAAALIEGILAGCRQVLVPERDNSTWEGRAGDASIDIILLAEGASTPQGAPSAEIAARFATLCETTLVGPGDAKYIDSESESHGVVVSCNGLRLSACLAGCAGHLLTIRCFVPFEAEGGLSIGSAAIARISEDAANVAASLAENVPKAGVNGVDDAPLLQLVGYLDAVCRLTCCMKPPASPTHYSNLLALLLHLLSLSPVCVAHAGPTRETTPLTSSFPAAAGGAGTSRLRGALLNALRALLEGSSSHQLRGVLSFVEHALSSRLLLSTFPAYQLPSLELCLMLLEGCGSTPALRTLGQHAERLAYVLSDFIAGHASGRDIDGRKGDFDSRTPFEAIQATIQTHISAAAAADSAGKGNTTAARVAKTHAWATLEHPALLCGTSSLAIATALRALESLFGRPRTFSLGSRHLARTLQALDLLWGSPTSHDSSSSSSSGMASCFANTCYLLMASARHQERPLGRLMPECVCVVRGLLLALVRREARCQPNSAHQVRCADLLGQVLAEISGLKAASKYCAHILGDYLIVAAAPPTAASAKLLRLHMAAEADKSTSDNFIRTACSSKVGEALRQGVYAVYGACGASGVQYLYASLGGWGGSGMWRTALAELKNDHDKSFKYTGKV